MRASKKVAVAVLCGIGVTIFVSTSARAGSRSGDYSVQVLSESGRVLPTFVQGGRSYAMGSLGHRYALRIRNASDRRVEFVAAVDGRDVLDGKPSDWGKRGYIVNPHGEVVIDGFRLSHEAVAAFRFSSLHSSYASRMGDARDVGVIGVAVFPERRDMPVAKPEQPHFWNKAWGSEGAAADQKQAPSEAPTDVNDTRKTGEMQASADAPAGPQAETEGAPPPPPASEPVAEAPAPSAPAATPPATMEAEPTVAANEVQAKKSKSLFRASGVLGHVPAGMGGLGSAGLMGRGAGGGVGFYAYKGAPAPAAVRMAPAPQKMAKTVDASPGLGTEFGERRTSQAEEVEFVRASSQPATVVSLHYDNKEGLLALGIDVDRRLELAREARLRRSAEPFRRNGPVYESSPSLLAR